MLKEYVKILFTNAVVDPRAVVIKSIYTNVAKIAMPASWCSNNLAFRAQAISFKLLKKVKEL